MRRGTCLHCLSIGPIVALRFRCSWHPAELCLDCARAVDPEELEPASGASTEPAAAVPVAGR